MANYDKNHKRKTNHPLKVTGVDQHKCCNPKRDIKSIMADHIYVCVCRRRKDYQLLWNKNRNGGLSKKRHEIKHG